MYLCIFWEAIFTSVFAVYSGILWNKKNPSEKTNLKTPLNTFVSPRVNRKQILLATYRPEWSNTIIILLTRIYIPKMDLLKEIKTNSCELLATEKTKDKKVKNQHAINLFWTLNYFYFSS